MKNTRLLSMILVLIASLLLVTSALAAVGGMPHSLVGSGGGLVLRSTIGQPIAGTVGNGVQLCSGFHCGSGSGNNDIDLAVTKFDTPDPATAGGTLSYMLVVTNSGPFNAVGVILTDTLPAEASFVSAVASQGTGCNFITSNAVVCDLGDLSIAAIVSTFDIDDEGWTVFGHVTSGSPAYSATGGNPGGTISASDDGSGIWY